MRELHVSKSKDYIVSGKAPVFLLADSVWSAFSNMTYEDWEYYLDYRCFQGFNAVQISVLPLTGESSVFATAPFMLDSKGGFDFYKINEEYFEKAQRMLKRTVELGFVAYLAVTICNYIPDESEAYGQVDPSMIMPVDALGPYVEKVITTFDKFNPVYYVSEDTSFPSEKANNYYWTILRSIKRNNPRALTAMHTSVRTRKLPDEFIHSELLDLYVYQAGHFIELQDNPYKYAQEYYHCPVRRPIINTSVCYDGHGYGYKYGRFSEFNIRKSIWQSILAGAKAGITYGAHGVWNWHKRGSPFRNEKFSSAPYDWRTAIGLKGAWEASYAKWIFESYNCFDLEPALVVMNEDESQRNEIRIAKSSDESKVLVYLPYSVDVKVNMDLTNYEFIIIDLADKRVGKPRTKVQQGISILEMHDFNSDALIIGKRKK